MQQNGSNIQCIFMWQSVYSQSWKKYLCSFHNFTDPWLLVLSLVRTSLLSKPLLRPGWCQDSWSMYRCLDKTDVSCSILAKSINVKKRDKNVRQGTFVVFLFYCVQVIGQLNLHDIGSSLVSFRLNRKQTSDLPSSDWLSYWLMSFVWCWQV